MSAVRALSIAVFCDVNVLVDPVRTEPDWDPAQWPTIPPVQGKFPPAVQILKAASESCPEEGVHLVTSDHVLRNVRRALVGDYGWVSNHANAWVRWLHEVARASGGEFVVDAPQVVVECADREDNLMLDGAVAAERVDVIVSRDERHVLPLATNQAWRGMGLMSPRDFLDRLDASVRGATRAADGWGRSPATRMVRARRTGQSDADGTVRVEVRPGLPPQ